MGHFTDPFHGPALITYLEVWTETGQLPPDSETVRKQAYQDYAEERAQQATRPPAQPNSPENRRITSSNSVAEENAC